MIQIKNLSKLYKKSLPFRTLKDLIINFKKHGNWFRQNDKLTIINNLSINIESSEIIGIYGKNGTGKSTLAKIIAGTILSTMGSIKVNGDIIPFLELGIAFNPDLNGLDNLYLNGSLLGLSLAYLKKNKFKIFEFAGVTDFMYTALKFYSSGMQLKLAFSIAMHAHGDVYIFDEILAVGDQEFQNKCFVAFEKLKNDKKTIIIISHDLNLLLKHVTSLLYLENDNHYHITGHNYQNIKTTDDLHLYVKSHNNCNAHND